MCIRDRYRDATTVRIVELHTIKCQHKGTCYTSAFDELRLMADHTNSLPNGINQACDKHRQGERLYAQIVSKWLRIGI